MLYLHLRLRSIRLQKISSPSWNENHSCFDIPIYHYQHYSLAVSKSSYCLYNQSSICWFVCISLDWIQIQINARLILKWVIEDQIMVFYLPIWHVGHHNMIFVHITYKCVWFDWKTWLKEDAKAVSKYILICLIAWWKVIYLFLGQNRKKTRVQAVPSHHSGITEPTLCWKGAYYCSYQINYREAKDRIIVSCHD
jgi:hypothetical protein